MTQVCTYKGIPIYRETRRKDRTCRCHADLQISRWKNARFNSPWVDFKEFRPDQSAKIVKSRIDDFVRNCIDMHPVKAQNGKLRAAYWYYGPPFIVMTPTELAVKELVKNHMSSERFHDVAIDITYADDGIPVKRVVKAIYNGVYIDEKGKHGFCFVVDKNSTYYQIAVKNKSSEYVADAIAKACLFDDSKPVAMRLKAMKQ